MEVIKDTLRQNIQFDQSLLKGPEAETVEWRPVPF